MLTPQVLEVLQSAEFSETGRKETGYQKDGVDTLLDNINNGLSALAEREGTLEQSLAEFNEENVALKEALADARNQEPATPDVGSSITLLSSAEKIARDHIADAESAAENIKNDAYTQAEAIIASRRAEYEALEDNYKKLSNTFDELRNQVRTDFTAFLKDDAPAEPGVFSEPVKVEENSGQVETGDDE